MEMLPFESLRDWRSYADLVAVVEVAEERSAIDPVAKEAATADPLRYVTLTVQRTLWSRRPAPPEDVEIQTWGWTRIDGDLVDEIPADGPRLEVGQAYVIGLVLGKKPGAMTMSSVLPLDGEVIDLDRGETAFPTALDGLTVDELQERLLATEPDPVAAAHEDLPPAERADKVNEVEGG